MECHLGKMFHRLEVHAGINNIVCEVEEKFVLFNGAENVGQNCPKNQGFSKRTVVRAVGGMDPFDFGKEAFNDHLQSLADDSLCKS